MVTLALYRAAPQNLWPLATGALAAFLMAMAAADIRNHSVEPFGL